jgi:P-type E1-E2 ATPase
LQQMSAAQAKVLRGGERHSIAAKELVPGDVSMVEEGDTIPADARLIASAALQTSEAALTGESLPVSKDVAMIAIEADLGDQDNMIFSGTAVTYRGGHRDRDANPDGAYRRNAEAGARRDHAIAAAT